MRFLSALAIGALALSLSFTAYVWSQVRQTNDELDAILLDLKPRGCAEKSQEISGWATVQCDPGHRLEIEGSHAICRCPRPEVSHPSALDPVDQMLLRCFQRGDCVATSHRKTQLPPLVQ